jgi:hypothetical protein
MTTKAETLTPDEQWQYHHEITEAIRERGTSPDEHATRVYAERILRIESAFYPEQA